MDVQIKIFCPKNSYKPLHLLNKPILQLNLPLSTERFALGFT